MRREELYSLAEDPSEQHNIIQERTDAGDEFRERLANYLTAVYAGRSAGSHRDLDETTRRQLESLGYIIN